MCHVVLLMPVLGLPLLWLLPGANGVAAYALVVAVSVAIYVGGFRAMRRPVAVGVETLLHAVGTVRFVGERKALVWLRSELWSAKPEADTLAVGDAVEVTARDGLTLIVRKVGR